MNPSFSVRNLTPTSAAVVVLTCSSAGMSPEPQMLHGQLRVDTGGGGSCMSARVACQVAAILS